MGNGIESPGNWSIRILIEILLTGGEEGGRDGWRVARGGNGWLGGGVEDS